MQGREVFIIDISKVLVELLLCMLRVLLYQFFVIAVWVTLLIYIIFNRLSLV